MTVKSAEEAPNAKKPKAIHFLTRNWMSHMKMYMFKYTKNQELLIRSLNIKVLKLDIPLFVCFGVIFHEEMKNGDSFIWSIDDIHNLSVFCFRKMVVTPGNPWLRQEDNGHVFAEVTLSSVLRGKKFPIHISLL